MIRLISQLVFARLTVYMIQWHIPHSVSSKGAQLLLRECLGGRTGCRDVCLSLCLNAALHTGAPGPEWQGSETGAAQLSSDPSWRDGSFPSGAPSQRAAGVTAGFSTSITIAAAPGQTPRYLSAPAGPGSSQTQISEG